MLYSSHHKVPDAVDLSVSIDRGYVTLIGPPSYQSQTLSLHPQLPHTVLSTALSTASLGTQSIDTTDSRCHASERSRKRICAGQAVHDRLCSDDVGLLCGRGWGDDERMAPRYLFVRTCLIPR